MPAAIVEYFPGVDLATVSEVIMDYQPVIQVLQHTWSHETFLEIIQGKVSVPDDVLNDAISQSLENNQSITSLSLHSRDTGRLDIEANSAKLGRLEFSGTIEEFVHNPERSSVTYRVKERALKDHGLASWFFSRISVSMAQKLFGRIDFGEELPTKVKGNYITVDCTDALRKSELGTTYLEGYSVLDMLEIQGAEPHEGYITFKTKLNIPDEVKTLVLNVLR